MIANQIDINSSEIYAGNTTKYDLTYDNNAEDIMLMSRKNVLNNTTLFNTTGRIYVMNGNHLDTISYEVICSIGKRIPRVYKK